MAIKLSSLPPDLQRLVLAQAGMKAPPKRQPRRSAIPCRLERVCRCGFQMFRPDGNYPDCCDGCGCEWPR
jgi:hypothetical protein